ncbi:MAG TPA: nitroreductase family protein [Syntrophomonadaceae bacterium]|nr:nitroreductase family protein [Syntrophomonadaceae bacterium]
MDFNAVIQSRRSIRSFSPDPVPDEYIQQILESARLAPSGSNIQPWRFVVIKSPEARSQLAEYTLAFVAQAPVVIVCCTDLRAAEAQNRRIVELKRAGAFEGVSDQISKAKYPSALMDEAGLKSYMNLNTAIAVEHMILTATALGLGSCWVMMFQRKELAQWLELPDNLYPLCLLPIGYPAQDPAPRPRKALEELIIKEL